VLLPELDEYRPTAQGDPPLARAKDWVNTIDPETGKPATRETNTMPQWAGSCWYFLRFVDPCNNEAAWSKEAESYWMPVDLYIGGAEHAVLHLLYSRFWHKVLYDAGLVSTSEPFQKLFNQGMILAYSFKDALGKYHYPTEVERRGEQTVLKTTGEPVVLTCHLVNWQSPLLVIQGSFGLQSKATDVRIFRNGEMSDTYRGSSRESPITPERIETHYAKTLEFRARIATKIADLTDQVGQPVDVLLSLQLGGGNRFGLNLLDFGQDGVARRVIHRHAEP